MPFSFHGVTSASSTELPKFRPTYSKPLRRSTEDRDGSIRSRLRRPHLPRHPKRIFMAYSI